MDEVPDSDGEEYLQLPPNLVQPTTPNPAPAPPTDSISSFPVTVKPVTSTKDSISSSSSVAHPQRPKPRPAFKGSAAHSSVLADSSIVNSFSDHLTSSLSDRVKMRQRGASKGSALDSTSSSRRAAVTISSDVIEIADSDSDVELKSYKTKANSNVQTHPKPQSKVSALETFSSSSNGMSMPSPNQPAPKTTFAFEELLPPITTLTAAGDTSFDPDSSPSTLAQKKERSRPRPRPKPKKKPAPDYGDDHMWGDLEEQEFGGYGDMRMMPPPNLPNTALAPTLSPVAGPSVSSTVTAPDTVSDPAATTETPSGKPPKKTRKKQGGEEGEKPAKKPRAKKAKKDSEEGEGGGADKPKKKKKGKGKEMEEFKSAEFIDDDDDELMAPIDGPPPLPLHSPMDVIVSADAASGAKPVSAISIPDSQADEELAPLIGEKRKRLVEEDGGDSAYTDAENTVKTATTEKKRKKAKTVTVDKTKKKGPAKKAKGRTIMSDDEDGGAGGETSVDAMVLDLDAPVPPAQTNPEAGDEALQEKSKPARKKSAKKTVVSDSEAEEDDAFQNKPQEHSQPRTSSKSQVENAALNDTSNTSPKKTNLENTPKPVLPSISSRYTIAPRTKSTPMAELIRKVNSRPGSPFPALMSRPRTSGSAAGPSTPTMTYSTYNKFSRSALSRIAPLHPNRRTPPPPLPPPPPKPKTKKEKEREEQWEEEMIEAVGGWDEWKLLSEQEQKAAKRAKWARELEGWED